MVQALEAGPVEPSQLHPLVNECIFSAVRELDEDYIGTTVQFDEECNTAVCSVYAIGSVAGMGHWFLRQ
jgi:hypothetical protein